MRASEPATEGETRRTGARSPQNHVWLARRRRGTFTAISRKSPTAGVFGRVVGALWPWSAADYPGIRRGMLALLAGRVRVPGLRHWMADRRRAPLWAWQLLCSALDRRIAELEHARALARAEIERLEAAGKDR